MKLVFSSFIHSRRGSISISAALLLTAVIGAVGAAVDFSNAHNRRSDIQAAADAAALAGAARPEMTDADIKEMARYNLGNVGLGGGSKITVVRDSGGKVSVDIVALSPTFILGVVGITSVTVEADSAAVFVPANNGKIEVALVLDTTQSMADDMDTLRTSAQELANTLFDVGGANVKVSVVPYVASVNIGNGTTQMAWMDTAGTGPYHGYAQRGWDITRCNTPPDPGSTTTCDEACGCPGEMACGGGDDGANLIGGSGTKYAGGILQQLLGTSAATAAPLPYTQSDPNVCPVKNPPQVNYFDLLETMANADWMGCVEARPAPHDVTDTAPVSADPDTRFVPYFWSDDADWLDDDVANTWANNYVDDDAAGPTFDDSIQYFPTWRERRRVNVWKYQDAVGDIDETTPNVRGPNRACPDPMLPLTSNRNSVETRISSLTHRNGGGTIISEGLMWGWRAISPGAPFSEGAEYDDETRKIIIVMSDGANSVIARVASDGTLADEAMGDYTAYGYGNEFDQNWPSRGLMDTSTNTATPYFDQVREALNERTAEACSNIKSTGTDENKIEIYTVLVGDSDPATEEVMATCATTRTNHYKEVSQMSVLQEAFGEVAQEIAGKGSSRLVY